MIELTGISLAERKKELNAKINDAAKNKTNFDELKSQKEQSDVDKLYKIGVASKYKDVEYIIEILKSGDSLYISKALKCIWLYDNEYSHIINPEYLHENIFPLMSIKMTKKFLITISMYLSDTRAIDFYTYCNGIKYTNIAMKFLIFTPQSFKLKVFTEDNILYKLRKSNDFLKLFLGNSFDLAEAYYNIGSEAERPYILYEIRHFYSISDVKYIGLLNKMKYDWSRFQQMGLRNSKDIMEKHKDEIYKRPITYLYLLNRSMLVRYSTVDDAKFYAKALIAHECHTETYFWALNFCENYASILNKIPSDQRLGFIKHIFTEQYPHTEFEMCIEFYNANLHKLMTPDEREDWALRHIRNKLELLGPGKDFLWYRFVSFDKALPAIKRYVLSAVDIDVRTEVISVLVESAKTDIDLETLFDYYYKRHVNEQQYYKEQFVDAVLSKHNVYNFGESSWNAFNKILFSLEVYNVLDNFSCRNDYKCVALIYHLIHGKAVPDALTNFIESGINMYVFKEQTDKLPEDNVVLLYQYLLQFYLNKIQLFDYSAYNYEVKRGVRKYIHYVLDLLYQYQKQKENIPEIVNKYIQLDFDEFRGHLLVSVIEPELTQQHLIGYLKKNKKLVISNLPLIRNKMNDKRNPFKFNTLLKILRIYFSNDLATMFLKFFNEIIAEQNPTPSAIKTAVYGIFELADIGFKTDFMTKYVPEEAKIDHINVDRKILCIQEAICKMACYSRPPIPLSDITKYIKGDYVKFCLPIFNAYLTKVPKPLRLEFVKSLLDRPLSVQKHGVRMAFECFSIHDLKKVIMEVWNNTINVSLRSIIYIYMHNKIKEVDVHDQNELFEDLKSFTRTLGQEDDGEVFRLLTSNRLPWRFTGEYLEIAWIVIDRLPARIKIFIERRKNVIDCIHRDMYLIKKEVIESIIYDHVNVMLKQEQMKINYEKEEEEDLVQSKWNLFHKYVTFYTDEDDFHKKAELIMVVIKESLRLWDKVVDNKYILKQFVSNFVIALNHNSYNHDFGNYMKTNRIFDRILTELQNTLSFEEIYEIFWSIRMCVIVRNVLTDIKKQLELETNYDVALMQCYKTLAKEFTNLLVKSIVNRQCFVSHFDVIVDKLGIHIREMLMYLNYGVYTLHLTINRMFVLVCLELLEYNIFETYMFAAMLLPCDIEHCMDNKGYLKVIDKLKSCEFNEVKFYIYRKFVTLDYNFKDFMVPKRHDGK